MNGTRRCVCLCVHVHVLTTEVEHTFHRLLQVSCTGEGEEGGREGGREGGKDSERFKQN